LLIQKNRGFALLFILAMCFFSLSVAAEASATGQFAGSKQSSDISKIAMQFNKAEGQEGYDLVLDWSRDGRINITDISAGAKSFNKRYSPQPWV